MALLGRSPGRMIRRSDALVIDSEVTTLAPVKGTSCNDSLVGTAGTDTILGGGGNDTLRGLAGNDSLLGGGHADRIFGGDDNDTLAGGAGNDSLNGGTGSDTLQGNSGNDYLAGDRGNDRLEGQSGNDTLAGKSGNDTLQGNSGNDRLAGGNGNDRLEGQSGQDTLTGGGGNDSLTSGTGADLLTAGDGDDTLVGGRGADLLDGGVGTDTAVFAGKIADYEIATVAGVTTVVDLKPSVNGDDGTDTLTTVERLQFVDGVVMVGGQLSSIDLATLTPDQGVVIYGAGGGSGFSVSSAGDVNGDGIDDVIVGTAVEYQSRSHVIFGTNAGFPASIDLTALTPSQGFVVYGAGQVYGAGRSVSSAGDINGDGFDDLILGARYAGEYFAGESYVIFGTGSGFGASVDVTTLTPGQGFAILGAYEAGFLGSSVSSAGDVNGDGFDDLIVGAPGRYGYSPIVSGLSYVIFGTDAGFGASLDLATLTSAQGFVIVGVDGGDNSGTSVSAAGDVNGDGFDDVIVGAPFADAASNAKYNSGESYVIFGTDAGFGASLDLATLTPSQGFVIFAPDTRDHAGLSVSSAGDVNGDGIDDLLVGAPSADAAGNEKPLAGETYLIFGTTTGFGAGIDLAALEPSQGIVIHGADAGDKSGTSVSAAGDVNGDGVADLMIGAYGADGAGNAESGVGETYVIFGGDFTGGGDVVVGTSGDDVLVGTAAAETLAGGQGNDSIVGGTGTDTAVFAGSIADYKITTVAGSTTVEDLAPSIDGNDGTDTLRSIERLQFADGVRFIPGARSSIELALLTAAEGSVVLGAEEDDRSGTSVRSAGDLNGDGFDDVIIGAPGGDAAGNARSDAGESYVIFGTAAGLEAVIDLAALAPSQGFVVYGASAGDYSGVSVSSAGDLNGDGFDDLIVGATGADAADDAKEGAGESYVIFGTDAGFGAGIDLASLTPEQGFVILGADAGDQLGVSVSSARDVNGDGFDDLIIAAAGSAGESYVIFGTDAGFGAGIDLVSLTPAQGFVIRGSNEFDQSRLSVSSAGDVNGDGFDDLIVGNHYAGGATSGRTEAGETYVIFGTNASFGASIDLATLPPSQGFLILGAAYAGSGASVSSAGDVNGDGFDDLVIGAAAEVHDDDQVTQEQSFVVFGTAAGFGASIDLASLTPSQGFVIHGEVGEGQNLPMPVSSAGDVNGDGFDDLIVGGPGGYGGGASYVIFGTDAGFEASLDLAELVPSQGFVIYGANGGDYSGGSVSAAGDVNGDGFDDLIIGAPEADSAGDERNLAGESYVIYGGDFTGAVVFAGTGGADILTGTAAAETFVGGQGDDAFVGGGGVDAFQGGEGDDTIAVANLDFLADGGNGTDTLRLDGTGLAFDLTALADNRTRSIEQIDITGSGDNSLTLSALDVLNISDESNDLLVKGDAGDTANIGGGWATNGTANIGGQTYQIYTAGQATLLVDTDVSTVAV